MVYGPGNARVHPRYVHPSGERQTPSFSDGDTSMTPARRAMLERRKTVRAVGAVVIGAAGCFAWGLFGHSGPSQFPTLPTGDKGTLVSPPYDITDNPYGSGSVLVIKRPEDFDRFVGYEKPVQPVVGDEVLAMEGAQVVTEGQGPNIAILPMIGKAAVITRANAEDGPSSINLGGDYMIMVGLVKSAEGEFWGVDFTTTQQSVPPGTFVGQGN